MPVDCRPIKPVSMRGYGNLHPQAIALALMFDFEDVDNEADYRGRILMVDPRLAAPRPGAPANGRTASGGANAGAAADGKTAGGEEAGGSAHGNAAGIGNGAGNCPGGHAAAGAVPLGAPGDAPASDGATSNPAAGNSAAVNDGADAGDGACIKLDGDRAPLGVRIACDAMGANVTVEAFASEAALLQAFVALVQRLDPDIVVGYDLQKASLGKLPFHVNLGLMLCDSVLYSLFGLSSRSWTTKTGH